MPSAPCSRLGELHTSLVDAVDGVVPLFLVLGDEVVEETGADNVSGRFWGPGAPRNGLSVAALIGTAPTPTESSVR